MTERAETASKGRSSGLGGTMARKALAPLVSTMVHAASAYLGRKAGEIAQEKLVPKLQGRSAGNKPAESAESSHDDAESSHDDDERRDRAKRRTQRRKALDKAGSS